MIRVYAFEDAPNQFRLLSEHGGDEDWVVETTLTGDANKDEDIMTKLEAVVSNLDRYDFGGNGFQYIKIDGVSHAVYIIAHS